MQAQAAEEASETPTRILVVDDESFVRLSLVAYLEDSGYEVTEAVDGEDGLAKFRKVRPDLVLCDLRMPRLDGLALLQRAQEIDPLVPIIVVSGAGVISDVVEALRLGASDYLIKPIVDLEVLEHAVNRSLERARLRQENQRYREELEEANRELARSLEVLRLDQQAGREVQRNMLPSQRLAFGPYTFTHRVIPSLYLSGDFVDYFALSERFLMFYIADVSGHGASSAFVTVLLKNLSYELLRQTGENLDETRLMPSRILNRINDVLLQVRMEKHMTTFLGILDRREQELRYAVGGHYPYPFLRMDGEVKMLEEKGLPVGLFEQVKYEDRRIPLKGEFFLSLFSDGVMEVLEGPDLSAKEEQLRRACATAQDAESLAEALGIASLPNAPDDIAILTVSGEVRDG